MVLGKGLFLPPLVYHASLIAVYFTYCKTPVSEKKINTVKYFAYSTSIQKKGENRCLFAFHSALLGQYELLGLTLDFFVLVDFWDLGKNLGHSKIAWYMLHLFLRTSPQEPALCPSAISEFRKLCVFDTCLASLLVEINQQVAMTPITRKKSIEDVICENWGTLLFFASFVLKYYKVYREENEHVGLLFY